MATVVERQEHLGFLLLSSENYREFLLSSFKYLKESQTGFSLTSLARKAGCRSKSYPREVMTGRRSLSFDFAPGFAHALGLKGEAKKLFLKFVELERSPHKESLGAEIGILKSRIKNRIEHQSRKPQDLFSQSLWVDLYAALGSLEKGAALEEIQARTGFKLSLIQEVLKLMLEKNIIAFRADTGCFYPLALHHFFVNADQDQIFQKRFLDLTKRVEAKAKNSMKSDTDLFQCSTISIHAKDLPKLKSELRELLNRFVQEAESADGNRLAHIVVGMIS
ncbi:MAG: TIGR02147 family protein [Pseudobdellovibrionaceae bacterium]